MKKSAIGLLRAARKAGTPLVAISTSDQNAITMKIWESFGNNGEPTPKLTWDSVRGLLPANDAARQVCTGTALDPQYLNPVSMLAAISTVPPRSIVVMANAYRWISEPAVAQGVYNLRDLYPASMRTLVLLGPSFALPAELQDVVNIDDPLPGDSELEAVISRLWAENLKVGLEADTLSNCVDAVRGLSAFGAEQVVAMSLLEGGIDLDTLWEHKAMAVSQTRGLKFVRGGLGFDRLGGLDSFKEFAGRLANGRRRFGCVVFFDEIEKVMAGAAGDTSGVSQDYLQTILTWMENGVHDGLIAVGAPGTGKTASGMALGATFDRPTIVMDLGAMKGQYIGTSEAWIREALKVIDSIAGDGGAFVVATCNKEAALPPELKRRFRKGTWYWDLPTAGERRKIWDIHGATYELNVDTVPPDEGWTGAEIRNCCDFAANLGCTLFEAAQYVIPVSKSNPQVVESLRAAAHGKWLSASYEGAYRGAEEEAATPKPIRRVKLDG